MRRYKIKHKTTLAINKSLEGETIEMKIERIVVGKEPIEDTAPIIYTDRRDGVIAGYDIRTDRFELALDAMDIVDRTTKAKREERYKPTDEIEGGGEEAKG